MTKERIAVLGGGVAGLAVAKQLATTGRFEVDILERTERLGGLQRSVEINGAIYDVGAFTFAPEHELLRTFPILRETFVPVDHYSVSLTHSMTLDRYPMSVRGYLRDHGAAHAVIACIDLLASKLIHRRRDTLRSFVTYYLGGRVYLESGLRSYIERFYGVPDTEVDIEFVRQRMRALPEETSLRVNARRLLREAFASVRPNDPWHCYVRSPRGFEEAYTIIGNELRALGVRPVFGSRIRRIARRDDGGGTMIVTTDDGVREYDHVVSTIPVPAVVDAVGLPNAPDFPTMSLVSLFYRLDGDPGFSAGCLYNFTGSGLWKRITLFSNYYGLIAGEHYFAVECTVHGNDAARIEEQRRAFEQHIPATPLFRGDLKFQGGLLTPNAYPYYRRGDHERLQTTKRAVEAAGLHLAGRQGRFDYLTSHEAVAGSRGLAGAICAGAA